MAIDKKLILFKTRKAFDASYGRGDVLNSSIVFIEDTGELWTKGKFFCKTDGSDHNHNGVYLPINGKAADSAKLNGKSATSYVRNETSTSTASANMDANAIDYNSFKHDYRWDNAGVNGISSIMDLTYSGDWRTQMQFKHQESPAILFRSRYNGTTWTSWGNLWSSFNFDPTIKANKDGSNASGTWDISITGNSTTATTATKVNTTVVKDTVGELVRAMMADNDYFRIAVGGASNAGYAEIATGDDGSEPIYVRQYSGAFTTIQRTATLLDGTGATSFPVSVTAPTFIGNLTGNVTGNVTGNADTVTNGVYTNTAQNITAKKTFTVQQAFTVAQGTSPFTVTSNTVVTNLNADLLDGLNSSAFQKIKYANHTYNNLSSIYSGASTNFKVTFGSGAAKAWNMFYMELSIRRYDKQLGGKLLIFGTHNSSGGEWGDLKALLVGFSIPGLSIKFERSPEDAFYISGPFSYTTISIDKLLLGDSILNVDMTGTNISTVASVPTSGIVDCPVYNSWTSQNFNPDLKANLASPSFTGIPVAPTAAAKTNTTQIATTAFVRKEVSDLVGGAPETLDTLKEISDYLTNGSIAGGIVDQLGKKVNKAGDTMSGALSFSAPGTGTENPILYGIKVYNGGGGVQYGLNLIQVNDGGHKWGTNIYGPNQSSRRIYFSKINTDNPLSMSSFDIKAYINLDNGDIISTGGLHANNFTLNGNIRSTINGTADNVGLNINTSGNYSAIRFGKNNSYDGVIHYFEGFSGTTGKTINLSAVDYVTLGLWNTPALTVNAKTKQIDISGNIFVNSNQVWHSGNFNPVNQLGNILFSHTNSSLGIIAVNNTATPTNANMESSIGYRVNNTAYWTVGKGTGGIGTSFGWYYSPSSAGNKMTLSPGGVLNAIGGVLVNGTNVSLEGHTHSYLDASEIRKLRDGYIYYTTVPLQKQGKLVDAASKLVAIGSLDNKAPLANVYLSTSYIGHYDSDFIEVELGEVLEGSIMIMRPSGATGTSGTVYVGIERYDKNKKPISSNAGCHYTVGGITPPSDGVWRKYTGFTTMPLTHTAYSGSDGGPVRYIKVRLLINYSSGTIPTYWSSAEIRKMGEVVNTYADQTIGGTKTFSSTITGSISGNSGTSTKLATKRKINGTDFDGTADITTANWGTARNLTIGNTAKSVNGGGNVSWTLAEIGAAPAVTGGYLPLSGGTMTGLLTISKDSVGALTLERRGSSNAAVINFKNSNGDLGAFGMTGSVNSSLVRWTAGYGTSYTIWDSGNSGTTSSAWSASNLTLAGTITGATTVSINKSRSFDPNAIGTAIGNLHLNTGSTANDYVSSITFSGQPNSASQAQAGIYVQGSTSYGTKMYFVTTDSHAAGPRQKMILDHTGKLTVNSVAKSGVTDSAVLLGAGGHLSYSTSGTASTIAARDSAGDLSCRLVRASYGNEERLTGGIVFRVNNSSDNYLRVCSSPSAARTWLGAAPSGGSTSISSLASQVTFGTGGSFTILQNDGSWHQRIRTGDSGTTSDKRFIFDESQGNTGSSWVELFSFDGLGNGWLKGNKIWHAGNDGSGSGLDADLLDGLHLHTGRNNEANKVVRTDGSGYINAGWINTLSGSMSSGIDKIYCSNDSFIRYISPDNFKSTLGLFHTGNANRLNSSWQSGRNYNDVGEGPGSANIPTWMLSLRTGLSIYSDAEFKSGTNSVNVYNNTAGGGVTISHINDSQSSANGSGKILQITTSGAASPGLGGFYQTISARTNAVFAQIFRAKIPTGYRVMNAENAQGDGARITWLTPREGTGKWAWYCRLVYCGNGGSMSSGGHVYLEGGSAPVTWYLASIELFDLTKISTVWHSGNLSFGTGASNMSPGNHTHSNYVSTITTTGSGNAITSLSISGNTITANKGTSFLPLSGGTTSGALSGLTLGVNNSDSTTGRGLSLYAGAVSGAPTYGIMFAGTATFGKHGGVQSDWATYLTMSDTTNRGWIFRRGSTNVASISGAGNLNISTITCGINTVDAPERYACFYGKSGYSYINFGHSAGTNNCGELTFNYVGAGNASNFWQIALYGGNGKLQSTGGGGLTYNGNTVWHSGNLNNTVDLAVRHLSVAGNITQTSSFKYKTEIFKFEKKALDLINKINVVSFKYKTDLENEHIGFIAEDTPSELSTKLLDKMDMGSCIGVLLKAVQELQEEIKNLKK